MAASVDPIYDFSFYWAAQPCKSFLPHISSSTNIIATIAKIETAKQQLERLEWTDVEDLPTVKYFLDKVDERDRKCPYQNVTLPFVQATK